MCRWFVVFNATFDNISVISWQSVLLVEEIRVPRENHRTACCKSLTNCITSTSRYERDSNSQL